MLTQEILKFSFVRLSDIEPMTTSNYETESFDRKWRNVIHIVDHNSTVTSFAFKDRTWRGGNTFTIALKFAF